MVYNLSVAANENFYISEHDVLVHNEASKYNRTWPWSEDTQYELVNVDYIIEKYGSENVNRYRLLELTAKISCMGPLAEFLNNPSREKFEEISSVLGNAVREVCGQECDALEKDALGEGFNQALKIVHNSWAEKIANMTPEEKQAYRQQMEQNLPEGIVRPDGTGADYDYFSIQMAFMAMAAIEETSGAFQGMTGMGPPPIAPTIIIANRTNSPKYTSGSQSRGSNIGSRSQIANSAPAIERISANELHPTHSIRRNNAFLRLKEDIRLNGITETIKVVENNGKLYVVDGHHRLRAAAELGIHEVPIERVQLPYKSYNTADDLMYTFE